jgi:hypothetical protein
MSVMKNQLTLLSSEGSVWHLDEETRERGRKGVAAARAALQQSRRVTDETQHTQPTAA